MSTWTPPLATKEITHLAEKIVYMEDKYFKTTDNALTKYFLSGYREAFNNLCYFVGVDPLRVIREARDSVQARASM